MKMQSTLLASGLQLQQTMFAFSIVRIFYMPYTIFAINFIVFPMYVV